MAKTAAKPTNGVKKTNAGATKKKASETASQAASGVKGAPAAGPLFRPLGQYIKDLSFECPRAPMMTPENDRNMDLNVGVQAVELSAERGLYEVALAIRAEAKDAAKTTVFMAELAFAGVFELQNIPSDHIDQVLHVEGASLLFPFARKIIMQTLADSGFRPPLLDPINFGALYVQSKNASNNS